MTIKEIAKLAGRTDQAVRNWLEIAQQNKLVAQTKKLVRGRNTEFTLEETVAIIRSGGNDTLADLLLENAKRDISVQNDVFSVDQTVSMVNLFNRMDKLTETIGNMVTVIAARMEVQEDRIKKLESKFEEKQALLPAPEKSSRSNLNQIVRNYAIENEIAFKNAWNILYKEFDYRMNTNIKTRASHREMSAIDYIESEGMMDTLLSVAIETMANKKKIA